MTTGKALNGKPYAGNPHVRFDEGEVASAATPRRGSLLYKRDRFFVNGLMRLAACALMALACVGGARGDSLTLYGYITYTYTVTDGIACITDIALEHGVQGGVHIPASLNGYPVKRVTAKGIRNKFVGSNSSINITTFTIEEGIEEIGPGACSLYTESDGVVLYLPTSLKTVGAGAFPNRQKLRRVVIDDLAAWSQIDFAGASANPLSPVSGSLQSSEFGLYLRDKTYLIQGSPRQTLEQDFSGMEGIGKIGSYAFAGYASLTNVAIPASCQTIGAGAFSGCGNLQTVTGGAGLTHIGEAAFQDCTKMTACNSCAGYGITNISDSTFSGCTKLSSVPLSSRLEYIGDYAFYRSGVGTLTLPASVRNIGNYAFSESSLTSMTIPYGVVGVGEYAFSGCNSMSYLEIPNSVQNFGMWEGAFCSKLIVVVTPHRFGAMFTTLNPFATIYYSDTIITLNANGGNVSPDSLTLDKGAAYTLPVPQKEHFLFAGWWTQPDGGSWVPEQGVASDDMICYAHWNAIQHTVTFDANGGTCQEPSRTCNEAEAIGGMPTAAWNDDYQFDGWFTEREGGVRVDATLPVMADMVLYAHWTRKTYSSAYIVIDLSGGPNASFYPITAMNSEPSGGFNTDEYKTTKLILRKIPAGTFTMGSPSSEIGRSDSEVQHSVSISKDFYMGLFEVTQRQYELVMGGRPSTFIGDARPVESVSYDYIRGTSNPSSASAVDEGSFMGRIRAKTGNLTFNLPTEAQWEYACRAGTTTALNNGMNLANGGQDSAMDVVGRYGFNDGSQGGIVDGAGGYSSQHTTVGSYSPNNWGLYDMHGNVWEWCLDWYNANLGTSPVTDPICSDMANYTDRVFRGGGWDTNASGCRSAFRYSGGIPSLISYNIGFRLSCSSSTSIGQIVVSFDENRGASGVYSHGYMAGAPYGILPTLTRIGYEFTGWFTAATGGSEVTAETLADESVTILYAHWNAIQHTVTFDANGGQCLEPSRNCNEVEPIGELPIATRGDDYQFDGWFTDRDGGMKIESSSFIVADMTLYAHWTRKTYSSSYIVIDLSGGASASFYPITEMNSEPSGGFNTEEYKTTKLVLRKIPAGTFTMGSMEGEVGYLGTEAVPHAVTITRPFYLGVFEVTQRQYEQVMGSRPSLFGNAVCYAMRPVEQVSWNDIRGNSETYDWPVTANVDPLSFMGRLRAKTGIESFDLPTEAKWEYVCRAGTTTAFNKGADLVSTSLEDMTMNPFGRYRYNGGFVNGSVAPSQDSLTANGTAAVGTYEPNAWGFYDMHGNVWECCLDWYQGRDTFSSSAATDPTGSVSGTDRVRRGGGWYDYAVSCRSACRYGIAPSYGDGNIGFRLSCSAGVSSMPVTISFDGNGGTVGSSALAYTADDIYGSLPVATRTGYEFVGWFTASSDGTQVTEFSLVPAAQAILYAHWNAIRHTVTFDANGGQCLEMSRICNEAEAIGDLPNATRNGNCQFEGWFTERDGGTKIEATSHIMVDMTLYAHWVRNIFSAPYIVIDLSGGTDASFYPISAMNSVPSGGFNTDVYKTTKLVLRKIPAGTFTMGCLDGEVGYLGNETMPHAVTISKPFYMAVFEVTQRQYELVMGNRPSYFNNVDCYATRPVEQVSWNEIRGNSAACGWPGTAAVDSSSFMGRLRAKTGIDSFDLPTEAKWEYACRAGTTTAFNNGADLASTSTADTTMDTRGRYRYNGGFIDASVAPSQDSPTVNGTVTVGSYEPNAWGLYDMHGNVWEWCLDWYQGRDSFSLSAVLDPLGPSLGTDRVRRGGGWYDPAVNCRSAFRAGIVPSYGDGNIGFRLSCLASVDPVQFIVSFDENDGSVSDVFSHGYMVGSPYGTLPALTRVGYTFAGWFTAATEGNEVTEGTLADENVTTLYAHWDAIPVDPIPQLDNDATREDVVAALAGSSDSALSENIHDAATYNSYRAWAYKLVTSGVTAQMVKDSPNAWLSFALDTDHLINPRQGDLQIDKIADISSDRFELTFGLNDVAIGEGAEKYLRKVFDIEGANSLEESAFSHDNVVLNSLECQTDGKVKVTITPKVNHSTFFIKVRMR